MIDIITEQSYKSGYGAELQLKVTGSLNFHAREKFQDAYRLYANEKIALYSVDCEKVDFIDSSGLALLLILKEYAEEKKSKFKLCAVSEVVHQILILTNLNESLIHIPVSGAQK